MRAGCPPHIAFAVPRPRLFPHGRQHATAPDPMPRPRTTTHALDPTPWIHVDIDLPMEVLIWAPRSLRNMALVPWPPICSPGQRQAIPLAGARTKAKVLDAVKAPRRNGTFRLFDLFPCPSTSPWTQHRPRIEFRSEDETGPPAPRASVPLDGCRWEGCGTATMTRSGASSRGCSVVSGPARGAGRWPDTCSHGFGAVIHDRCIGCRRHVKGIQP